MGDGSTDDSAALAALVTTLSSGGIIYFPPNYTFRIGANVNIPLKVTMWFAPGTNLTIDGGVTLTIAGGVISPMTSIFSGSGYVVYATGANRTLKVAVLSSGSPVNEVNYLPMPGDSPITITLPSFSTVKRIKLVFAEDHPVNGNSTTWTVSNFVSTATYISFSVADSAPSTVYEFDAELQLTHVTGSSKAITLRVAGTDTIRYQGWVEVEYL